MIRKWVALTACCLLAHVSILAAADGVPGCCPDAGCTRTVCQPTCVKATVTTRHYTDRTEEFCLPCSAFSCLFPNKCGCSHVRTKKLLILKLHKCEKYEPKCVPVQVPVATACAPACDAPCVPAAPVAQPAVIIPTMPAVVQPAK